MPDQKGIFWLASYPKSGNTWFRLFLSNLLSPPGTPVDLNAIQVGKIISLRETVENALGFDSADLSHDEMDTLRPAVHQWLGEQAQAVFYYKTHDAYAWLTSEAADKIPLFPNEGSLGALYFIRNPLDIVISFANHLSCSIDETIGYLENTKAVACSGKYKHFAQVRHCFLSWSLHVESWASATTLNKLVIRYEDMKLKPMETFTKAVNFLNILATQERIIETLDKVNIEKLQVLEQQFGFCEKPRQAHSFFRKGIVGDWQNKLSGTQIARIIASHGNTMKTYGYLDDNNQPIIFNQSEGNP